MTAVALPLALRPSPVTPRPRPRPSPVACRPSYVTPPWGSPLFPRPSPLAPRSSPRTSPLEARPRPSPSQRVSLREGASSRAYLLAAAHGPCACRSLMLRKHHHHNIKHVGVKPRVVYLPGPKSDSCTPRIYSSSNEHSRNLGSNVQSSQEFMFI